MRLDEFDYQLPPEAIAQTPAEPRDSSRLMVLDRATGMIQHGIFHSVADFLRPNDLLVINDTRVIPARLFAKKRGTGGQVEILLLRRLEPQTWEAIVGGKRVRPGTYLVLTGPNQAIPNLEIDVEVLDDLGGSRRVVRFSEPVSPQLDTLGTMPLPPYIHEPLRDPNRYQTVYADQRGSAAAPTAGLHFTPELLDDLREKGIRTASITLHVGLDTFAPITEERVEDHAIHSEYIRVSTTVVEKVRNCRAAGGRIIAVGTSSVRALESAAGEAERIGAPLLTSWEGQTRLFITPGYVFRAVDGMITNFHLPRSSLLVLVSAFAGREKILSAYEDAKREKYRFYSFGDAMLIR
jgi:S-adenosylmethionine:tRNA ribosyltransferase-isomerase